MEEFDITFIRSDERQEGIQAISEEIPLTIEINGKEIATLLCSPENLKELVYGFLYTSGLILKVESIRNLTIDTQNWKAVVEMDPDGLPEEIAFKRIYTSGCGKGVIFHNPLDLMKHDKIKSDIRFKSGTIRAIMKEFLTSSNEYRQTHGVHSVALASSDGILVIKDDIGRHNAMDKVIGQALIKGIDLDDKLMLKSGRVSSEIISKIIGTGCPVIVAAGSPTNQAVKMARSVELTLIGMARGKNMNIYSRPDRIV